MTVKPICIIKLTRDVYSHGGLREYQEIFENKLPDYHVFVVPAKDDPSEEREQIQFQVFYEKDFTDIQYNELKEIITQSLNQKP